LARRLLSDCHTRHLESGGSVATRRKYHPTDFGEAQWRRLLTFALAEADAFECAIPYRTVVHDLSASPLWPEELNAFRGLVMDRHVSLIRWEFLHDYPTQFVRLRLTPGLKVFIRRLAHLQEWSWATGHPEDPALYGGGAPILETESVAGRVAVYADPKEVTRLMSVGVRLLEPLGVKPEPWPTP